MYMLRVYDVPQPEVLLLTTGAVLHRQHAIIQPVTVVAVALIRLCKTTLPPVVILREAVAVHAVIPAVLPVRQVVVLQEEDRYSIQ